MTEEKNLMTDENVSVRRALMNNPPETLVRPEYFLLAGRRPETEEKQGGDDQPVFLIFMIFMCIFAPYVYPHAYNERILSW